MTTYNYEKVLVWEATGGTVRVLRNGRVTATNPDTGAAPANLMQGGVPVTFLTSDAQGSLEFQADDPKVRLTSPNGLSEVVVAPQAVIDAVGAAVSSDAAVAGFVNNPASATRVAGDAVYLRPTGAGVARFITRAKAGAALKIVGIGDSVTAGTGATLGTNDFLTLVKNDLGTRFPSATITQSNRGLSGATIATNVINGYLANAIADAGDLYIISFGKNDTVADAYGVPVQGYPLAQAKRGLEVMVRELRRQVPQADIIVMAENPNTSTDTTGNANLQAFNKAMRSIAAAYGCEWVDAYTAFTALGSYSSYLADSVHPSVAGHRLIADTLLASIPDRPVLPVGGGRPGPDGGITAVTEVKTDTGLSGWVVRQDPGASQNGVWVNSGTWSGSNPYQSTTVNDYVEFTFVGTEFMLRMSTASADALVVDVTVDGVTTQTNLSMTTLPSAFQPFVLLASGLTPLQHKVRVTLKSGTFKVYQAAWLSANIPQVGREQRRLVGARYYGQAPYAPATTAPAAGTATVVPFFVPRTHTINQIACDITTLAASSTVALGIYGSDEYDQPLGLVVDAGAVASDTTGFKTLTIATVLTPGWYWLAALSLGGAPAMRSNTAAHELVTTTAASTASALNGYTATGLSALPARWTSTSAGANSPRVVVRPT